jgi:hypothetical protein
MVIILLGTGGFLFDFLLVMTFLYETLDDREDRKRKYVPVGLVYTGPQLLVDAVQYLFDPDERQGCESN